MPVMICMLRGVNLGGHNQIKMDTLRDLCQSLRLRDARTYIQSGNVVFATDQRDPKQLTQRLEDAIEHQVGFRPRVLLRTTSDLRDAVSRNPFAGRKDIEPGKLLVNFLAEKPPAVAKKRLEELDIAPEELHVTGREMFIYFPNGQARPRLKWPAVDRILNQAYTGRNWNTVNKLLAMAEELEPSA